jgi:hypothetical protein
MLRDLLNTVPVTLLIVTTVSVTLAVAVLGVEPVTCCRAFAIIVAYENFLDANANVGSRGGR